MSWLGSECSPHKRRIDEVEPAPAHGEKKHEYAGNGSLVGSDRHPFDPHAGRRGAAFPRLRSLTARCRAGWPDGRSKRPTRRDDVALNLAFIPVTFECTILAAALSCVLGMLALNGLPMPYHPVFSVPRFQLASRDRYFLMILARDPRFRAGDTFRFMETLGASLVSDVED